MKNTGMKRFWAVLLTALMLVSMIPASVLATEDASQPDAASEVALQTAAEEEETAATSSNEDGGVAAEEEAQPEAPAEPAPEADVEPETPPEEPAANSSSEETPSKAEEHRIIISFVDEDGKAIADAKLVLTDENGKEIAKWTTTDKDDKEDHKLDLKEGSYLLEEKELPEDYEKASRIYRFEVDADGKIVFPEEDESDLTEEQKAEKKLLAFKKDAEDKAIPNHLVLTAAYTEEYLAAHAEEKEPTLHTQAQGCTPSGSDPYFDIYWLDNKASEETTKTDSAGHSIAVKDTPTSDTSSTLTLQAEFSIGRTTDPIEAGEIQVVLPRYPFTEWDWDKDGTANPHKNGDPKFGVGQKPAQSGKSFYWYFARYDEETGEYVEDNSGEYVILENYESVSNTYNTPITFTVEMTYPYMPSRVDESKTHTVQAQYLVKADGYCVNKNNEKITAQIETGSKMDSVRKTVPTDNAILQSWNDEWGSFSDTGLSGKPEDYVYARFYIYASVYGSDYGYDAEGNRLANAHGLDQPYYLYIDEEKPGADVVVESTTGSTTYKGNNQGKVVAFTTWGTKYSPHTEAWYKDPIRADQYEIVDGYVVGNKISGSSSSENSGTFDTKTATTRSTSGYFTSSNSNSCLVIVAYPKAYSDALRDKTAPYGDYDYLTNTVTVTKKPYNPNDPTETMSASVRTRDVAINFRYEGNLFRVNKFDYVNGTTYKGEKTPGNSSVTDVKGGKTLLELEQDVTLHTFRIDGYARGYGLTQANPQWAKDGNNNENEGTIVVSDKYEDYGKQPYKIEIIDDQLYLNGVLLKQGDYEIVSTYYSTTGERYLDPEDYSSKYYTSDMRSKPTIYYQSTLGGEWVQVATDVDASTTVSLPSGAVGVKYEFETKAYLIDPYVYLTVKLKGDSQNVKEALATSDGEAQVTDIASFGVFTEDGQGNRKYWNLAKENSITSGLANNIISYENIYHNLPQYGGENRYYQHDYAYQWLLDLDIQTSFSKDIYTSRTDTGALIDYRTYQLHSDQKIYLYTDDPTSLYAYDEEGNLVRGELRPASASTPGENTEGVIYYGQDEVTFYDLLPPAANLDASSLRATYQQRSDSRVKDPSTNYTNQVAGEIVEYQTISNYNNSGRTLLIAKVKLPDSAKASNWGISYDASTQLLQLGTRVSLYAQLVYPWEDLLFYTEANSDNKRVQRNYGAVWVPKTDDGFADDPAGTKKDGTGTSVVEDSLVDVLKNLHNGSDDEYDTYYGYKDDNFQPLSASLTGYSKMVKADSEATYRTNSAVQPEENYNYRLRYAVESDTSAKNIILYDVLEHAWEDEDYMRVDDFSKKYALTGRYWEGTFDHVDISALEYLGVAPVIYYSTTDRKTMQDGLNAFSKNTNSAGNNEFANVQNTKYWSKGMTADEINALSDAEKQKITAIAFDCGKDTDGNDFVLEYQDDGSAVLMAYIHMKAPDQDTVDNEKLVEPEYVYAYNNSFLSAQSKSSSGTWSAGGSKMSDGTTVRICEPNPPIFKLEEDEDEKAGGTSNSDMTEEDTMTLSGRDEVYKYTLTTKVPIMGVDKSGAQEQATFTIYDTLVSELEFAKVNKVKIEIGDPDYSKDGNSYFIYDPDGAYADPNNSSGTYKGFAAIFNGYEDDEKTPKYQMFYFNSLSSLPKGFSYRLNNQNYGSATTGASADNTISFAMTYSSSDGYDRVSEFMGEKVSITFYAKVREDATLGKYVGSKVPNTAHYTIPNHPGADSNTVYVKLDEPETPSPKKDIAVVVTDDDGNETITKENQKFYVINKSDWSNVLEDGSPIIVYKDADGKLTRENGTEYTLEDDQTIKTAQEIKNLEQTVQYTVSGQLPIEHESLTISDRLADALAMDTESIKVNLKGQVTVNELEGSYVKTDDDGTPVTTTREIDRTFTLEELTYIAARNHGLTFNATSQGFNIAFNEDFINRYGDYYIDGDAKSTTSTETDEEGNETEVTAITSWQSGEYGTTYTNTAKDYAIGGLEVTITFNATIKKGADLTDYMTETGVEVPNTANYRFGNNPTQSTDPVVIRPPREEIEKAVNNKNYEELASKSEPFTYAVDVAIPETADDPDTDEEETDEVTSLVIYDTLEKVLEFYELTPENLVAKITREDGTLIYTLTTEEKEAGLTVDKEAGTIEFSLDKALADSENKTFKDMLSGNQRLRIEFKARIKESVDDTELDDYREESSKAEVPNKATYKINDKYEYKSNTVHVTPPSIGKTVNKVADYYLTGLDEVFAYEITSHMPANDDETKDITSFVLTDTLEEVLEFADTDNYPMSIKIGDSELSAEEIEDLVTVGSVDEETGEVINPQTIAVTFGEDYVDNDDYKKLPVTFTFYAKIKDGADLSRYWKSDNTFSGIPNTAAWVLNFADGSSETEKSKPVNVYPPEVGKTVNESTHVDLADWDEEFTYKITTYMPNSTSQDKTITETTINEETDEEETTTKTEKEELTKLIFGDTIEDVLEFSDTENISFKIGGEEQDASKISIVDQKLSVDLLEFAEDHKGELVEITFKAKLKEGLTLEDLAEYVNDTSEADVPNEAVVTLKFGDDPDVEDTVKKSETVTVTPPPLEKKVNGKSHEDLEKHDETFLYTIKTWVPVSDKEGEKATSFKILDTLEEVLEFADPDAIEVKIGGAEATVEITCEDQNLTVILSEEQIENNPKAVVEVSFEAKIKEGANLSPYKTDDGILIPNTARYQINNDPEAQSNTVTVTPPEVEKTVNDILAYTLTNVDEIFTYRISGMIPIPEADETVTQFVLYDEMLDVLEFANEDTVITIDGEEIAEPEAVFEGQKVSITIDDAELLKANAGKYVSLTFQAKVRDDADLSEFIKQDTDAEIPNTAKVDITSDGASSGTKESKPVTVTPPPISKKVNGKDHEALSADDEVFTYSVRSIMPVGEDITKFVVEDTLENVLEFAEEEATTVEIAGDATIVDVNTAIKRSGQTITLTIEDEAVLQEQAGKSLVLTFRAKIREDADLSAYITDGLPLVPNTAKYTINDDPDRSKESNEVTVTPPSVGKEVNASKRAELNLRSEPFTYTISTLIPNDATKITFADTIKDVLEFTDEEASVTLDGETIEAEIEKGTEEQPQLITATVTEEALSGNGGKKLVLTFRAKIRSNADLSEYVQDGEVQIPNTATLVVNDDPERSYETKPVVVVPPDNDEPTIEKKVNDAEHADLKSRRDVFTYTIETQVPVDAKSFIVTDTLVDELIFSGSYKLQIGEEELDNAQVATDGQTLQVELTDEQLKAYPAQPLKITFTAVIKQGADITKYLVDGKILIPNTAEYILEDIKGQTKTVPSNEVTVTPPGGGYPDITKSVNEREVDGLTSTDEIFTYTIETSVPDETVSFIIYDTLVDELQFSGAPTGKIGENTEIAKSQINISGQTLTVTLTEDQLQNNIGESVVITFSAQIKSGADVSQYLVDNKVNIPNTARYELVDAYGNEIKKDSNKVHVQPPTNGGQKLINKIKRLGHKLAKNMKTGDDNNLILWLIILAAAAAVLVIFGKKRRQAK